MAKDKNSEGRNEEVEECYESRITELEDMLEEKKVLYRHRHALRRAGGTSPSFEVTLPYHVVRRYVEKKGVDLDEATERLEVEISYGDFGGLLLRLVKKEM